MNKKTVVWLIAAVMLLLALALCACNASDDKEKETETDSMSYPVPPSIPVAGETETDTAVPAPTETTPSTSETASDSIRVEPDTDAPETTLSALELQLHEAALRVAKTDGVGIVSACTVQMSGNAGQSGEYTTDTIWRRVNGNCSLMDTDGLSGFILAEDTLYLLDDKTCISGLSKGEKSWLTENLCAAYVLPIDPTVVVDLNAATGNSGTVVSLSGITREAQDELFASLGLFASGKIQLNSATGAVTLNAEGMITDASFSMVILYEVDGEQLNLNVEYLSSYLYDEDAVVTAPVDAATYTKVSFVDHFGELIPDEPATEPDTDTPSEPDTEPDTQPTPTHRVMYVTADVLRVRSSADFQSETNTVGYLTKGTSVTILEDYGSYAVIEYKGERCYIGTKFLSETRPED